MTYIKEAKTAGVFYLVAMTASLAGGLFFIEPVLSASNVLSILPAKVSAINIGVVLEVVNGLCVLGIAACFYSVFKEYRVSIAQGYMGIRIIEAVLCIFAAFIPLLLTGIGNAYLHNAQYDANTLNALSIFLLNTREQLVAVLVPVFFGLGAFLLYYTLLKTRLVPAFLSIWGLVAVCMILANTLIKLPEVISPVMALPIIVNEIFLGSWLIAKGFRQQQSKAVKA